jgi:hypothetical protein
MTDLCTHEDKEMCAHCELGCVQCGVIDGPEWQDDDGYCADCRQSRAEGMADALYDSMRDGY